MVVPKKRELLYRTWRGNNVLKRVLNSFRSPALEFLLTTLTVNQMAAVNVDFVLQIYPARPEHTD